MGEPICAVRAADALLRVAGGRNVLLRTPAPATAGEESEQLGLATPAFQDLELGPVVFRKARGTLSADKTVRWELMVSAMAVQGLVGSLAYSSARVLFTTSLGVVIDGVLMEIESVTSSEVSGNPYIYRLLLQAPHM